MPATYTYPGVYVEELPSSVHPIMGVTTSVAAFVDVFASGPVNQATQINSLADFARVFGPYSTDSESSYAIPQFFLNGGSTLYGFIIFHELKRRPASEGLARLAHLVAAGALRPHIAVEASWTDIGDVAQQLLDRRFPGKAVLRLDGA